MLRASRMAINSTETPSETSTVIIDYQRNEDFDQCQSLMCKLSNSHADGRRVSLLSFPGSECQMRARTFDQMELLSEPPGKG